MKASQKSLKNWTKEKWGTKSGKPSAKTGERYLPKKAREALSSAEYAATTAAKRKGTASGKQFVKQPKKIAEKTAKFRASEGGMASKKECPKCKGKGCSHCNGKGYHTGMYGGGAVTKKAPAKRMGYNHGGSVSNCGASMKPTQGKNK